jgi:hypothetical protein
MTTAQVMITLILGTLSILGILEIRIKGLVKHYLQELKPNGGSSMKDSVNRLERRIDEIMVLLIKKDN